ncbi:MAG: hypothetical protein HFG34_04695 [Eubacterium sp.]|nr:hypothetical protein [Eubacterium sp.]
MGKNQSRVSVYFDLDVQSLKDIYEPLSGNHYTNAYYEIRSFMEKQGYEHEQGSVYHSAGEKNKADVIRTIKGLQEEKPWMKDCVNKMSYARISEEHDLTGILQDVEELARNGLGKEPGLEDIFKKQRNGEPTLGRKAKMRKINFER